MIEDSTDPRSDGENVAALAIDPPGRDASSGRAGDIGRAQPRPCAGIAGGYAGEREAGARGVVDPDDELAMREAQVYALGRNRLLRAAWRSLHRDDVDLGYRDLGGEA